MEAKAIHVIESSERKCYHKKNNNNGRENRKRYRVTRERLDSITDFGRGKEESHVREQVRRKERNDHNECQQIGKQIEKDGQCAH